MLTPLIDVEDDASHRPKYNVHTRDQTIPKPRKIHFIYPKTSIGNKVLERTNATVDNKVDSSKGFMVNKADSLKEQGQLSKNDMEEHEMWMEYCRLCKGGSTTLFFLIDIPCD